MKVVHPGAGRGTGEVQQTFHHPFSLMGGFGLDVDSFRRFEEGNKWLEEKHSHIFFLWSSFFLVD